MNVRLWYDDGSVESVESAMGSRADRCALHVDVDGGDAVVKIISVWSGHGRRRVPDSRSVGEGAGRRPTTIEVLRVPMPDGDGDRDGLADLGDGRGGDVLIERVEQVWAAAATWWGLERVDVDGETVWAGVVEGAQDQG